MRSRRKVVDKFLYFACILWITLFLCTGCGKDAQKENEAVYVKTQKIGYNAQAAEDSYSGTVKGRYESNLAFQVSGKIISRNVNVGDRVGAGDVLMSIDDKDIRQNVNMYDAQVNSARSQLNLARSDLNRYRQLYAADAVSEQALDQYQSAYENAEAAYEQATAQARQGYNSLGYAQLTADSAGVISSVSAEAGQVVSAGQTVAALVHDGEREIEISVPENKIASVSVGQAARVTFWALEKMQIEGSVREISPVADSAARTYKVRISLLNMPDSVQLGMTANVSFDAADESLGAVLPLSALYQTGDKTQVWIVNGDSRLELKEVRAENFGRNDVTVVGLNKGDTVVVSGVHKLYEGESVKLLDGDSL